MSCNGQDGPPQQRHGLAQESNRAQMENPCTNLDASILCLEMLDVFEKLKYKLFYKPSTFQRQWGPAILS